MRFPPFLPLSLPLSLPLPQGNGKGVVGWKAPPKPQKHDVPKQPTPSQQESAKRLSQGLSVANTVRQRNASQAAVALLQSTEAQYSVVLDPQEVNNPNFPPGYMPNGPQNVPYSNGGYMVWPSTKAHR